MRLSERALPEAGISKSYCATSSSWPEVEPRFCPWIIWSINWSGDLTWALLYVAVMQRGARPKVSLKWTDLKLIARTHWMTKSSASWIESSTYSIRCSFLRAILQRWANTLTYWSPIRHRQYLRPLVEITKYRNFSQKISKRCTPKHRPKGRHLVGTFPRS